MAMLTLNGTLVNLFDIPAKTDKKTGEMYPAAVRLQIQAENTLQNGQKRLELIDIKVGKADPYQKLLGQPIRLPVGVFATGAGGLIFYALKNEQL